MLFTQMRKSMKVVIYLVVLAFAASLLYMGYSGRLPVGGGALGGQIAAINGEKITAQEFNELYLQVVSLQEAQGQSVPPSQVEALKAQLLNQMINGKLVLQAAKAAKIKVTRAEIDKAYNDYLKQYPSEKEFKDALKQRNLTAGQFRDRLRDQKMVEKMVAQVQKTAKVTEADLVKAYEQVHARHILLKVDKPEQDAAVKAKAEALVKQLRGGADFAQLAKKNSDDTGSKDKGGDLGFFGHGQMVAEFEKAAFALKVNEISDPVKTQYGYHIIQVLERKDATGPDFEKAKANLEKSLAASKGQTAFNAWFTDLRKKAKIEIKDAQLAGYQAASEGKYAEAKKLYEEALKQQPQNGYIYGDLARIAEQEKKPDEALKNYENAAKYAPGEAVFQFSLGELYQKKNETDKALAAYQKASDLEPNNFYLHYALMSVFKDMKRDDLAKKEEDKVNAIVKASQSMGQGSGTSSSGLPAGHPPVGGSTGSQSTQGTTQQGTAQPKK